MTLIRESVERLHAYVPGEQPKAAGVLKLNTNENPYPPSPRVVATLMRADATSLRLYPNPAGQALRERIATLHGCRPDNVFVGNGSDEVLALCARAFVERGGTIGYFEPSYSLYPVLAAIEDIRTTPVPLTNAFAWQMPTHYSASLFYLTNPNAPTGLSFPRARVRAFCRRLKGVVVLDEAYVDFAREHCLDMAFTMPNVLVARTLSKSYSLAGIRLGYAVGAAPLIAALDKVKDSYNVSALTQQLALAALADQAHMRRNVKRIVATREKTARALRARGWRVFPSDTNFLWARPASPARDVVDALRARKIFVRYFPGAATRDYVRITIGTDPQMRALLAALP